MVPASAHAGAPGPRGARGQAQGASRTELGELVWEQKVAWCWRTANSRGKRLLPNSGLQSDARQRRPQGFLSAQDEPWRVMGVRVARLAML